MPIFLDSADLDNVTRFTRLGIIRGVTTNPSILRREGVPGGLAALERRVREIASLIAPHPVAVEVLSNEPEEIPEQARQFAKWAENIVVKIPIHGPSGELHNLELVRYLETQEGIAVNVTAIASAQQCLLAGLAGASYVSLLGGRVNDMGADASSEIAQVRQVFDRLKLQTKLVVGSCREVRNVMDWLHAGADVVTVPAALLEGMLFHRASSEIVAAFLRDAAAWLDNGERSVERTRQSR
jgi:transaldolase